MDINKLTAMADRLSIPQLQQAMRDGSLPAYVGMPLLQQKVQESKRLQAAQAARRGPAPTIASQVEGEAAQHEMMKRQALAMQAQMAGTGGIAGGLRSPEPQAMAKGGAVAFNGEDESYVQDIYTKLANGVPLTDKEKQILATRPVNPPTRPYINLAQPYAGSIPAINRQRGELNIPEPSAQVEQPQYAVEPKRYRNVLPTEDITTLREAYTPSPMPEMQALTKQMLADRPTRYRNVLPTEDITTPREAYTPSAREAYTPSPMPEMQGLTKQMLADSIKGVDIPPYTPTNIQDQDIAVQPQPAVRGITPLAPGMAETLGILNQGVTGDARSMAERMQLRQAPVAQQVLAQQKPLQPTAAPQIQPQAQQPQGLSAIYNEAIAQNPIITAEQARKQREEYLGPNTGIASLQEDISKLKDEAAADKEQAKYMALLKAGLATMAGTSPYALTNIGAGAQAGVADFMDAQKEYRKTLDKQRDLAYKLNAAERQEKMDAFKFGEDSAAASRSANTALKIGQAKEVEDSRVNNARLKLEEQRNAISASSAANTAAYQKWQLDHNVYAQGLKLAEMQNEADKLRASGDEKGAHEIEKQISNRATGFDLANPSIYGQSQEQKTWNTTAHRLGADVNSLRTAMTNAQELLQKSITPETRKAAEVHLAKLTKEYEKAYTAYISHINTTPSATKKTGASADTQQSQWGITIGTKKNGYTYIGGNPNEESSWRKD